MNPAESALTDQQVQATLAEYGDLTRKSRFASLTTVDVRDKELIEVQAQQMGETLDQITRDELFTGATAQLATGKSAVSDIATSDTFDVAEIRKSVRTLGVNKALRYERGLFYGKISHYAKYDLQGDGDWVNATIYKDGDSRPETGDIGEVFGVKLWVTANPKTTASTTTVYSAFIHGKQAFGCLDLTGDSSKLYIVPNTRVDSNNPTGAFGFVGWRGSYVTKTLNGDWLINVKHGATA